MCFNDVLFIILKFWEISSNKEISKLWYSQQILYSSQKWGLWAIFNDVDNFYGRLLSEDVKLYVSHDFDDVKHIWSY